MRHLCHYYTIINKHYTSIQKCILRDLFGYYYTFSYCEITVSYFEIDMIQATISNNTDNNKLTFVGIITIGGRACVDKCMI